MKTQLIWVVTTLAFSASLHPAGAQGTAFTYQGRLNTGGNPANGSYDLSFSLYSVNSGGSAVAGPLINSATVVSNGLFTVSLDFGASVFNGTGYWLEIGVRTNGGGGLFNKFIELSPRQQLTPVPYAIYSENSGSADRASSNSVAVTALITPAAPVIGQILSFDGANLVWSNAAVAGGSGGSGDWLLTGNSNTIPGLNFVGTTDTNALELDADSTRVLRLEPDYRGYSAGNVIGGCISNAIAQPGSGGDTIAGGGLTGLPNLIFANSSGVFIGAGSGNQVGPNANDCVVAGGYGGTIHAAASVIGGGLFNQVDPGATFATIAGGSQNEVNGQFAVVAGGTGNYAALNQAVVAGGSQNAANGTGSGIGGGSFNQALNDYATIAGGSNNYVSGAYSTIAGGALNFVNAGEATVSGGSSNRVQGTGAVISGGSLNQVMNDYASIPGGFNNYASGLYSLAAGQQAQATNDGSFVWADSQGAPFGSTANDQFCIRAQGGLFLAGSGGNQLMSATTAGLTVGSSAGGIFGSTPFMQVNSQGLTVNGTLVFSSDRNLKENLQSPQPREVLDKVADLPITEWSFKTDLRTRHIGPMAQDFYAAFNLGADDQHIATVDEGGVALAAIQGLNQKVESGNQRAETQIQELKAENTELKARLVKLEQLLNEKNGGVK